VKHVEPEIILIILIFGGILAIMLYKYLLESPEYAQKRTAENIKNTAGEEATIEIFEEAAKQTYILFDKVEELEKRVDNLEDYLSQKVEIWKKQKRAESSR